MVRLGALPAREIIDGFKGKVDFYLWKGIPCARSWPRYRPRAPTSEEREAQETFSYATLVANLLPPFVVAQYRKMTAGTPWTWKDLFIKGYLKGDTHEV